MSGTSMYSHKYGDHDDIQNPHSSRDVEVDDFGQGSRNSTAQRCAVVVIPFSYAALRGHVGVREEEGGGQGRPAHQEVVGGGCVRRGSWNCCVLSSQGPPLYRG
jgi:hypothetical protein